MLSKLIKHEFLYLSKIFIPVYVIYLGLALVVSVLARIVAGFEGAPSTQLTTTLSILAATFGFMYGFATMVLTVMTMFDNVRRFQKNMLTDEGYLTNTLPVTAVEHITAKMIGGITNFAASFVAILLGAFIVGGSKSFGTIKDMWDFLVSEKIKPGTIAIIFVFTLSIYLAIMSLGYLICCINSMANSKGAVGIGAAFGIINIGTVILAWYNMFLSRYLEPTVNVTLLLNALLFLVSAGIMFFLTAYTLKNRLNLQ